MIEALWSVEFRSNLQNFGAGVVVFETNRIFGGDSFYYYLGNYEVRNGIVEGEVQVTHYSGQPYSVFGTLDKFRLKVSGKIKSPVMDLDGSVVENPNMRIVIRCTGKNEGQRPLKKT